MKIWFEANVFNKRIFTYIFLFLCSDSYHTYLYFTSNDRYYFGLYNYFSLMTWFVSHEPLFYFCLVS